MANGDFGPRTREADNFFYAYYNAWVILGAHRLGQYDLARAGMEFLMGFREPEGGGFYSSSQERSKETKQDLWVVSACGWAALATGNIEVARGAAHWMRQLMLLQTEYPHKLYPVFSRAKGLHLAPDSGHDEIRYVVRSDADHDQFFFIPGIAAGFLARLFQATGEAEWLDLAKAYMVFAEKSSDYLYSLLRAGKVGWAASVLYTLTRERKYREIAIRVGRMLVATQAKDGSWAGQTDVAIGFTGEMIIWLDEIYQALG